LYLFECAIAISYLLGIVYRNLRPEHVLIARDGHVTLIDFMETLDADGGTISSAEPEVRSYSAPDVLLKQSHGFAEDWWALGALAFELVVGAPPFGALSTRKMRHLIVSGNVKVPAAIGFPLAAFISELLQKKPEARLGSASEADLFNHEIFAEFDREEAINKRYTPQFVPDEVELMEVYEGGSGSDDISFQMPGFSWDGRDLSFSLDALPEMLA
jgi:serine/threonine protein kinase